ncbi:MAG: hypothetical protein WCX77_04020 [Candidatus Paceibacterota bacterium]|jgi:hypothetical protein
MKKTRIVSHLGYSDLFKTFQRNGLVLFANSLKTTIDFEKQIYCLLESMDPVELIQFSSFLNMICQTCTAEMSMVRGLTLLIETKVLPANARLSNKIVFHRENLLNLIGQIIEKKIQGNQQLTGRGYLENQNKYCQAILFNNDLLSLETGDSSDTPLQSILRNYFIKEWPYYYLLDIARNINKYRILRYRYCYESLLPLLEEAERKNLEECIYIFKEKTGVSIQDYIRTLDKLFVWFLEMPYQNTQKPVPVGQQKYGFDFLDIRTFYIDAQNFKGDPSFIKIIDSLARDFDAFKKSVAVEKSRTVGPITGYNRNVRVFFENPIFKISEGYYCIIDLKFLIDNVCGGLLFRVVGEGEKLKKYKPAYGRLMEEYFKFLIENIFKDAKISFGGGVGVDAIIEDGDKVFVIEFTTEYYCQSSLYNPTSQGFVDDAYRLLFNTGKSDPRSRGKSDKGKLIKLEEYIKKEKEKDKTKTKTITPILVTENILGDKDLFNSFGNFYDTEIKNKKLVNLEDNPPLFLCLDDLETFWSFFEPEQAVESLADFTKEWIPSNKGPQFHNATAGIIKFVKEKRGEAIVINKEFCEFFTLKRIFKK